MKQIKTKLSNLHKLFQVAEYEKELFLTDDIYIETLDDQYVRVNALVKKRTPMLAVEIEGINKTYVCAEKHIVATPDGWAFMKDCERVMNKFGESVNVLSKNKIGEQDSYDVALDEPHTYVTANGLVHHNTFLALYRAIEEVLDKTNSFKRVVIVRSCVPTRDVGFLPGSLEEKQEVYEMPYKEISTTLFDRPDAYERLKEQGYIKFISTTAIRGISIDDSVILVDEAQSMTFHELSTIISRTGHRSKIVFCGDMRQNDLIKSKNDVSGFLEFQKIARSMREFSEINFTTDDIVRSSLVKNWIIAAESFGY